MVTAYLGIGANLGDCLATLQWARQQLQDTPQLCLTGCSSLYETDPVGGPADQALYLNAVMQFETNLEPLALLQRCHQIELAAGRERQIVNGPRTLDIDLLLYGDLCSATQHLTLPHPRMHERRFVLVPMCDIAPQTVHPQFGKTVQELLSDLDGNGVKLLSKEW